MALDYQTSDPIVLGSGELYIMLAKDIADPENLDVVEEDMLRNIGAIESGATIDIAVNKIDVRSSNRGLIKKLTTDKDIRFSTGVMTWIMENVSKYLLGSDYVVDATSGQKKLVISENDQSPEVYLRFVHKKKTGGELIVNIYRAIFDGDLSFVFNSDTATTINYEFAALTNSNKNYVEFIETDE